MVAETVTRDERLILEERDAGYCRLSYMNTQQVVTSTPKIIERFLSKPEGIKQYLKVSEWILRDLYDEDHRAEYMRDLK